MTVGNKNNLRTIEARIVQKLQNNEARPKCTGSYKKACIYSLSSQSECVDVVYANLKY